MGRIVDSLFEEDGRSWDEANVRSIFEDDVADMVLQIPFSYHMKVEEDWGRRCPLSRVAVYL
jgi:hypothetical protein